jgi:hypothetical protein
MTSTALVIAPKLVPSSEELSTIGSQYVGASVAHGEYFFDDEVSLAPIGERPERSATHEGQLPRGPIRVLSAGSGARLSDSAVTT